MIEKVPILNVTDLRREYTRSCLIFRATASFVRFNYSRNAAILLFAQVQELRAIQDRDENERITRRHLDIRASLILNCIDIPVVFHFSRLC